MEVGVPFQSSRVTEALALAFALAFALALILTLALGLTFPFQLGDCGPVSALKRVSATFISRVDSSSLRIEEGR